MMIMIMIIIVCIYIYIYIFLSITINFTINDTNDIKYTKTDAAGSEADVIRD